MTIWSQQIFCLFCSWTFSFSFNSADQGANPITLYHGCLEGLPCLPPAAAIANRSSGHIIYQHNTNVTVIDLNKILITFCCYILALALLVSITCNVQQRRHHREVMERMRVADGTHDEEATSGDATEFHDSLQQPLLADQQDNEGEEEEEDNPQREDNVDETPVQGENV